MHCCNLTWQMHGICSMAFAEAWQFFDGICRGRSFKSLFLTRAYVFGYQVSSRMRCKPEPSIAKLLTLSRPLCPNSQLPGKSQRAPGFIEPPLGPCRLLGPPCDFSGRRRAILVRRLHCAGAPRRPFAPLGPPSGWSKSKSVSPQ